MTTYVRFAPEDRVLDLSELSQVDYDLVAGLRGNIDRGDGTLICLMPGGQNGEMYIRRVADDIYRAVHFPGGAHGPHPVTLETVEHRRQKEYWARAAEDNGFSAIQEVPVRGAGVMDVTISGGAVATDIEVQHSPIPETTVKTRTTRYARAGFLPVWFNDAGGRPTWLNEVPALGCNPRPWDVLPSRRAVTATGLGVLRLVTCDISVTEFNGRCPDTGNRPCGRRHPVVAAGRVGVTVDDVAGMIPSEQLVPLRYRTGAVLLVSPGDFARYQDSTGGLGAWYPGSKAVKSTRTQRQDRELCRYPGHRPDGWQDQNIRPVLTIPRADVEGIPRTRRRAASGRPICPGCNESGLTYGRALCQTCALLARGPVGSG